MPTSKDPEALLSHLLNADGSTTFSYAGYTIVGAVSGPIEAPRRDELPGEAAIDVVVRPVAGVGGTRERHLESLLHSTLRQVILVNSFPRALIQITLQVTVSPENAYVNRKTTQPSMNLALLPALLQTSILALLSAAIPMTTTLTSVALAIIDESGVSRAITDPSIVDVERATSLHVLAFTSQDDLMLSESEGDFTMKQWDDMLNEARRYCCTHQGQSEDAMIDDTDCPTSDLRKLTRSVVQAKTATDLHWKAT